MNVQVLADPSGRLLWLSPALPGAVHDVRAAREHGVVDAVTEAAFTVRNPTPCSRIKARYDIPARASRRIAAYKSTLDFGGAIAAPSRRARQCSHRNPSSVARTHRHRPPAK